MTARPTGEPHHEAPPEARSDDAPDVQSEVEETVTPRSDDQTPDDTVGAAPTEPEPPAAEPAETSAPTEPELEPEDALADAQRATAELTADLQRLQAEYLNYKRRVDRDRELVRENATFSALAPIVDVLDTIDRAREHGDLDEGFQAVADQLERVVTKAGLVKYGEVGDAFDPRLHEALSHIGEDPDVEVTTCKVIAKAGYRIGERVVRAAQVLVVDPAGA